MSSPEGYYNEMADESMRRQLENKKNGMWSQFKNMKTGYYLIDKIIYKLEKKENKWYEDRKYDDNTFTVVRKVGYLREKEGANKFKCQMGGAKVEGNGGNGYRTWEVVQKFKNAQYLGNKLIDSGQSGFTDSMKEQFNCSFENKSLNIEGGRHNRRRSPSRRASRRRNYRSKPKRRSNSSRT